MSLQYYAEANEAEQWMHERIPLATNFDTGKDQTAAESHLRRLKTLESEVDQFAEEISRLRRSADAMISAKHFDANNVCLIA